MKNRNIMKQQKGFTIIELIVVIAIIAILAAIVLINVTGYIDKGKDASIQEELHTVQTGVIADSTTSAGLSFTAENVCSSLTDSSKAWSAITAAQSGAVCYASTSAFCACAQSLSNTSNYFCVNSTGKSETTTTSCLTDCASGGGYACP